MKEKINEKETEKELRDTIINPALSIKKKAEACEKLAEILKDEKIRNLFYKKSAELREKQWIEQSAKKEQNKKIEKKILTKAKNNYKKNLTYYQKKKETELEEKTIKRIEDLQKMIMKKSTVKNNTVVFGTTISFLIAITFFSFNYTGFAIAKVEGGQSLILGAIFFILAILGFLRLIKIMR